MIKDKVLKSEIVYEGKIFVIKKDKVLLENGNEARRDILVHKGACAAVPITKDGKCILVRQYRHATGEFLWEIPAGGLEIGENPADCIVRELQEEIGYKPNNTEFIFQLWLAPGYSSERLFCYICTDLESSALPCDDDENIEIMEFSFEDIFDMISKGEIKDAKTIASCMFAIKKYNFKK